MRPVPTRPFRRQCGPATAARFAAQSAIRLAAGQTPGTASAGQWRRCGRSVETHRARGCGAAASRGSSCTGPSCLLIRGSGISVGASGLCALTNASRALHLKNAGPDALGSAKRDTETAQQRRASVGSTASCPVASGGKASRVLQEARHRHAPHPQTTERRTAVESTSTNDAASCCHEPVCVNGANCDFFEFMTSFFAFIVARRRNGDDVLS